MMKSMFSAAAVLLAAILAAIPARALELTGRITFLPDNIWVNGRVLSLEELAARGEPAALILARRDSPLTVRLLPELQEMIEDYGDHIAFALFFDCPAGELRGWQLFPALPECPVAADANVARILRDGRDQPLLCVLLDGEGQVVWIGSPLTVRPVLAALQAGTFDFQAVLAPLQDREKLEAFLAEGNYTDALAVIDKMLAASPDDDTLIAMKYRILFSGLERQEDAVAYLKSEIARRPGNLTLRQLEVTFYREIGDADALNHACDALAAAAGSDSARFLLSAAEQMLQSPAPDLRNAAVFIQVAMASDDPGEKAEALQYYARICQLAGKIDLAVQKQKEAVELLPAAGAAADSALEKLHYYQSAREAGKNLR